MPQKTKTLDFEQSLQELERLVEKMERGDLTLEESLKHFERAISLTRACQKALSQAEQKVKILLEKDGEHKLERYDIEPEGEDNNR